MHGLRRNACGIRRSMAVHAPSHRQIGNLFHAIHGFDRTVTLLASHADVHVRAVVEVDEIGKSVDARPRDRFEVLLGIPREVVVEAQRGIDFLNLRRNDRTGFAVLLFCEIVFGPQRPEWRGNVPMAIHAGTGWGNTGVAAHFGGRMAIHAAQLHFTGVQAVRERNGLDGLVSLLIPGKMPRSGLDGEHAEAEGQANKQDDGDESVVHQGHLIGGLPPVRAPDVRRSLRARTSESKP
jgi:hypothetical protein